MLTLSFSIIFKGIFVSIVVEEMEADGKSISRYFMHRIRLATTKTEVLNLKKLQNRPFIMNGDLVLKFLIEIARTLEKIIERFQIERPYDEKLS